MRSSWPNCKPRYAAPSESLSLMGFSCNIWVSAHQREGFLAVVCFSTYRPAWRSSWIISRPALSTRWSSSWTKASIQTSRTLTRVVRRLAVPPCGRREIRVYVDGFSAHERKQKGCGPALFTIWKLSPYQRRVVGGSRWLVYSECAALCHLTHSGSKCEKHKSHAVIRGVKCASVY